MKETVRARPTLICERLKEGEENKGGDEIQRFSVERGYRWSFSTND